LSSEVSSQNFGPTYYGAHKANDGQYIPAAGSREHDSLVKTEMEYQPYWAVDLETVHCIWTIRILNRGNCESY